MQSRLDKDDRSKKKIHIKRGSQSNEPNVFMQKSARGLGLIQMKTKGEISKGSALTYFDSIKTKFSPSTPALVYIFQATFEVRVFTNQPPLLLHTD